MKDIVQTEERKWSKKDYVESFLNESEPVEEETNWVAFKVLYDDTEEPIAGVQLKLRLPDGSIDKYTTDSTGRIYISGLPDGTCDVQEMLDNDALEVVEVLAG
ncbi:MAG: hypothetical protein D3924_17980 [Candidatus Electrothrix sp. AR4]|nr:hypothetical protein [Candidatus Electrothrix sp. AR4]